MPDHIYVYPGYLSKGRSRADGRRVPEPAAVEEPTIEAIVAAAQRLGYTAEPEADKQYPRRFYEYAGRVKISKRKGGVSKTKLLRLLAEQIQRAPPPEKK